MRSLAHAVVTCLVAACLATASGPAFAQGAKAKKKPGGSASALLPYEEAAVVPAGGEGGVLQVGTTADVRLTTGKEYPGLVVTVVNLGPQPTQLKTLFFKPAKGVPKIALNAVERLTVDGTAYDLAADPTGKFWMLLDETKRSESIRKNLAALGNQASVWADTDAEQLPEVEKAQAALFERLNDKYVDKATGTPYRKTETKHFLIYSALSPEETRMVAEGVEKGHARLCQFFNVPEDAPHYLGKCELVAMIEETTFQNFAREYLDFSEGASGAGAYMRYNNGRTLVVGHRQNDPRDIASDMIAMSANCFTHRLRTSVVLPEWIDCGIATAQREALIPGAIPIRTTLGEYVPGLLKDPSMGGIFERELSNNADYPLASLAVQTLLAKDPAALRRTVLAIKAGVDWKEALEQTYDLTPEQLAEACGRQIGVPKLKP